MDPITIIIAEDHVMLRQMFVSTLNQYEIHTIGEAGDGIEALELLKTLQPDIVLLDLQMPNMSGYNALREIKKLYPSQKTIVVTSFDYTLVNNAITDAGGSAFISKNSDIELFISCIRQVYQNTYDQKKANALLNQTGERLVFTYRENEVIRLMCKGNSNKHIAEQLNICSKTVEAHKKNIFLKTKTTNTFECSNFFLANGFDNLW